MLLPSDVARLVLGYLQQEKLLTTCRTFIVESSDLKEYAEHCTGEGVVPACLLSLFGKNLTTILNEYIVMKTKETTHDVPAMMSSLWKKLDYTLSQIRSMQNSSAFSVHQRGRTRSAIADMKKQKCLQPSASSNLGASCVLLQPGQLSSAPMTATQVFLKPVATPSQAQTRANSASAHRTQAQGSSNNTGDSLGLLSAVVQERKLHSSAMSPGKRKSDSQKKKAISSETQSSNSSSEDSPTAEEDSSPMEEESEPLEELIDGNFPQMVIENAREKILSNKCLQEKLAENINKFLGSDGTVTQTPKQPDTGPTIQESSIDELLGLQQGEIHMTEEAIQEILEQTESDPAFQGLFDMFDFGKTKGSKSAPQGILAQSGGEENAMLVDEENLKALESYIGTKEMSDGSQDRLSYTGDHSEEAVCILKSGDNDVILEEHLKMQSIIDGEFQVVSETRIETDSNQTRLDSQHLQHKTTFESDPDQVSALEFNENQEDSYQKQETAASRIDAEMETGLLHQGVQNLPELHYDQLDNQQKSLSERAECCSLPDNMLSENTDAKFLAPLHAGHSEMLEKTNVVDSDHLEDATKRVEQAPQGSAFFPAPSPPNPNSPTLSNFQEQNKLADSITAPVASASNPTPTELQLEVVDTSSSLPSEDQIVLAESCSEPPNQKSADSEVMLVEMQEPSSSTKPDADSLFLPSDNERHTEMPVESQPTTPTACSVPPPEPTGESSPGAKAAGSVSSSGQAAEDDPSSIVSLKIIISDDPFVSSETELNNAVSSITGDNLPTIILSSPAKSPTRMMGPARCIVTPEEAERTGESTLVEQNLLIVRSQDSVVSTLSVQNEECAVFSVSGASSAAKDGGFIQLVPGASTSFNGSNSVYIATCMTEPAALGTGVTPSNLVMLPGSSTSLTPQVPAAQQLRTPPRTSGLFAMNPPMSPNFSQGSAIIIASPVQPVLQGMVGMIPVSIMGQSGNAFSDPSRQVLHMPIQTSLGSGGVPKLPLPPKSQKLPRSKSNAGKLKMDQSGSDSVNRPGSRMQRGGNSERNACANLRKKLEAVAVDVTSSSPKQNETHRRVLYFDSALAETGGNPPASQKERNESPVLSGNSHSGAPSSAKTQPSKRERERTLPRILCKPDITNRTTAVKEAQSERKASGLGLASDMLRKQTANKENELERSVEKKSPNHEVASLSNGQQSINLHVEKNGSPAQEPTKKQGLQVNANSKNSGVLTSKEPKKDSAKSPSQAHCLTSPLTKQAVELLHDIQKHSPAAKLPENGDLPVPRTPGSGERHSEDTFDIIRTPTCKRFSEDSATPRIMVPPATPDLPACSPASETGSENSVSMAAHTLMILSRAAIARTSTNTPLKDNTQQFRSLRSAAKKRKQEEVLECERNSRPASKKDLTNFTVPIKKKKVKKKLPISFPAGMDVDKFLLSLHYDE
ncbi:protein NPAT isoform X2 [Paroedura picta]|uniref:protein NPAT isoform X2 n=1 Tax=Paroedura picta TaxID=143630 RepID=UPI004057CBA5